MLLASPNPSAATAAGVKPDPFAAPGHTHHRRVSFSTAPPPQEAVTAVGTVSGAKPIGGGNVGGGKSSHGNSHAGPGGSHGGVGGGGASASGPGRQGKFMRKMYKSHSFHQGMLEADVGALNAGERNTMGEEYDG
jgi:hypothetical protein